MRNIPSNAPGLVMVPGLLRAICEWAIVRAGHVATCVECASVDAANEVAGFPLTVAEVNAMADELLRLGQASASGATDYRAASQWLARHGIPNDAYGADWFAHNDFVPVVQAAIRDRGVSVVFGLYAAHLLYDGWTNAAEDAGVNGHAITIVGYDSAGAICADPNTSQAQQGDFVHYSWANLKAAGGSYPSMVIPKARIRVAVTPVWNAATGGSMSYPAHDDIPAIMLLHNQAAYANESRAGAYPLAPTRYEPGTDDSLVYWSDGLVSRAIKAQNWTVISQDAGPALAHAFIQAATAVSLSQQVASLQAQLAAAQAQAQQQAKPDPVAAAALQALQALAGAMKEL